MKKILQHLSFIFCMFYSNIVLSNETIYYIDMDFIMNNSLAGQSIKNQLENKKKSYVNKFKKTEDDLSQEEKKIISQKNILEKKEFDEKVNLFNKKVSEYRQKQKESLNNVNSQKNQAQISLVEKLNPILADYSKKNSISIILPKKSVIIGKTELDLTSNIIEILNTKIKVIKLK